ncbi:MAG: hypothetical protein OHK93_007931 [Ramalina farinacea]|uniref:Uncharacterized protein n=1 Tax=Ramalina farinacea TaxID=258253 RepID=A0AA43TRF4_9LECA|nr:hypothetical protein [Ramalina farinacea]
MRPSWSHYLSPILLFHHAQQVPALPAVPPKSSDASIPPLTNQTLSSVPNPTNATSTALTLWPPLPYTIPLYAGGTGTLTFSSSSNTPGSPAQLAKAQRIASWLSQLLTSWSSNVAIHFSGAYVPATLAADADAVQVNFVYAPATPAGQTAKTDLGNAVREFFDAEARFGCRALEALFAITEPAPVRGLGTLDLLLGWDGPMTQMLPAGAGSAAGRPVILLVESPAMPEGVMEVVTLGERFPSTAVRKRAYYLMTVMIDLLEKEFPLEMITNFGRYDSQSGLRVSYESERLVAVPRLDGEEIAAAMRTYRDLVVKRLGGCSIRFNVWKGSSVYGRLSVLLGTDVVNGTVLDGTYFNGSLVQTDPIMQLSNGTESDAGQLATT